MQLSALGAGLRRLVAAAPARVHHVGGADPADARRLADAEAALGLAPPGCAWLDERTAGDLDMPLVFQAIDRTSTPTGAQALWRWLAAPALEREVLADRERRLALAADPALRGRVRDALHAIAGAADAPHLPRLLWESPPPTPRARRFLALLALLAGTVALALWVPIVWLVVFTLVAVNIGVDDWANLRLAHLGRSLSVLEAVLAAATRAVARVPAALAPGIADDLAAVARLRKRIAILAVRDPFDVLELLRAAFLVRVLVLARCLAIIDRDRDRLRRLVLWVGELDALISIASLRAERADCRVPDLRIGPPRIDATDLVHPAIEDAIGNDLALDGTSLLVTGSNMSGKSTFLRTVAINAICAQTIHTTFGAWRASLFRVFAVMRTADDTAAGVSTYAVEVAAVGKLVAATGQRVPALLAVDEPFGGTNPTIRVPIVVAVLDYLAARDLAIAATHDLDVAAQVDARFVRGHFCELDELAGTFDRKLRPGVAPSSNALALLERAGYPRAILDDVKRRNVVRA